MDETLRMLANPYRLAKEYPEGEASQPHFSESLKKLVETEYADVYINPRIHEEIQESIQQILRTYIRTKVVSETVDAAIEQSIQEVVAIRSEETFDLL